MIRVTFPVRSTHVCNSNRLFLDHWTYDKAPLRRNTDSVITYIYAHYLKWTLPSTANVDNDAIISFFTRHLSLLHFAANPMSKKIALATTLLIDFIARFLKAYPGAYSIWASH